MGLSVALVLTIVAVYRIRRGTRCTSLIVRRGAEPPFVAAGAHRGEEDVVASEFGRAAPSAGAVARARDQQAAALADPAGMPRDRAGRALTLMPVS